MGLNLSFELHVAVPSAQLPAMKSWTLIDGFGELVSQSKESIIQRVHNTIIGIHWFTRLNV